MHYQVPRFTATVNPGSIAAEAGLIDVDVTVTGVRAGDVVVPEPGVNIPANFIIASCRVTAADTVRLTFANNNVAAGAAIDLASSTWKFVVVNRFVNTSTA